MPRNYRNLKTGHVRSDMNKYSLFALSRLKPQDTTGRTYFQQKWAAKSMLRAYHNPYVREGQWTRLFSRKLPAVVPMNYRYLARSDGSELAAGRGSGMTKFEKGTNRVVQGQFGMRPAVRTPYMSMLFFPMERRLDTAIFRALFASSTKQARQMVIHGAVKVNGKKMIYPGYLLNPGDMFSVEPDLVLYALGARKTRKDDSRPAMSEREDWEKRGSNKKFRDPKAASKEDAKEEDQDDTVKSEGGEETKVAKQVETTETDKVTEKTLDEVLSDKSKKSPQEGETQPEEMGSKLYTLERKDFNALRDLVSNFMENEKSEISAKNKIEIRAVQRLMNQEFSATRRRGDEEAATAMAKRTAEFEKMLTDLEVGIPTKSQVLQDKAREDAKQADILAKLQAQKEAELLESFKENPIDVSKPYATPWRPRPYMSAFAFIPRYLEVNQNICSAVYLRHPVARPGLAEVPSPFSSDTQQLGFNWYLRRE